MKKYGCKCWIADSNFHTFHVYVSVTYIPIIYIFMFEYRPIRKNSIQACTRMHDFANRILKQGLYPPDTGGNVKELKGFPQTSRCGDIVSHIFTYLHHLVADPCGVQFQTTISRQNVQNLVKKNFRHFAQKITITYIGLQFSAFSEDFLLV